MPDPPARYRDRRDLSVGEILEHQRSGRLPETPEYVEARSAALKRAGLEDDRPAGDPDDMSVGAIIERNRARRGGR